MTSTTRHLMVGLMMTGLVGAGRPAIAAGAGHAASGRVRSSSAAIAALVQQASERSKTFRGLVETINASDGIVYVEDGTCGHGVLACFVTRDDGRPKPHAMGEGRHSEGRLGPHLVDRP